MRGRRCFWRGPQYEAESRSHVGPSRHRPGSTRPGSRERPLRNVWLAANFRALLGCPAQKGAGNEFTGAHRTGGSMSGGVGKSRSPD
jgi:hypothetical protein